MVRVCGAVTTAPALAPAPQTVTGATRRAPTTQTITGFLKIN